MPQETHHVFNLPDEQATARLARDLGERLGAGDTVLLEGLIGAGKSFFARTVIQSRMAQAGTVEDVPSPTFTLVQTYHVGSLEIWHADLYRLGDVDEIAELGLDEAFENALCLIEWPERLGEDRPRSALMITLSAEGQNDARRVRFTYTAPAWRDRLRDLIGRDND